MITLDEARQLRALLEAQTAAMTDEDIVNYPAFVSKWDAAGKYEVGKRVEHGGKVYKCLQAHTAQEAWTPESAPSLWAEILPGQDGTEIGEWQQPDSTNPYMIGDRVTYNGKTWESTADNNVWAPGVYGWKEV